MKEHIRSVAQTCYFFILYCFEYFSFSSLCLLFLSKMFVPIVNKEKYQEHDSQMRLREIVFGISMKMISGVPNFTNSMETPMQCC